MAEFNLTGLSDVYREAYLRGDPTLTFELRDGRGRFVFMVFFAEDDGTARDILHLYLASTRILLEFKMYGSHRKGDFRVFVGETEALAIMDELQLGAGGRGRRPDLALILSELNGAIPKTLPPSAQIEVLRSVWPEVRDKLPDIVDEAAKTVLVGVRRLPPSRRPRARTLRKLYLVVDNDPAAAARLISRLVAANCTLVWTYPGIGIAERGIDDLAKDLR